MVETDPQMCWIMHIERILGAPHIWITRCNVRSSPNWCPSFIDKSWWFPPFSSIPISLAQADGICYDYTKNRIYSSIKGKPRISKFIEEKEPNSFRTLMLKPLLEQHLINAQGNKLPDFTGNLIEMKFCMVFLLTMDQKLTVINPFHGFYMYLNFRKSLFWRSINFYLIDRLFIGNILITQIIYCVT